MTSLAGRKVIITRAVDQAGELERLLHEAGANVVRFPTVAIAGPADGGAALRDALVRLHSYDWLVFTSANAVDRTFLELIGAQLASEEGLTGVTSRVAAIGQATARALLERGIAVDLIPETAVAEGLLDALLKNPGGKRVLIPRAAIGRDVLPVGLRNAGFEVDVVEAYRTVQGQPDPDAFAALDDADTVMFTSPSTVQGFTALAPGRTDLLAACVGPVTAVAAAKAGFTNRVQADDASAVALVQALKGSNPA